MFREDCWVRGENESAGDFWWRREGDWRRLNDESAAAALLTTANGPGYTLVLFPVRPWACDAEGNSLVRVSVRGGGTTAVRREQ
jgi:hypothetical protein